MEPVAQPNLTRLRSSEVAGVPRCKGYDYHVFALGSAHCSICNWNRYAAPACAIDPEPDVSVIDLVTAALSRRQL